MARVLRTALIASLLCALATWIITPSPSCRRAPPSTPLSRSPAIPSPLPGRRGRSSARWTVDRDIQGILLKPRGRGPFPEVVLGRGAGGNAQSYGRALGSMMRAWGWSVSRSITPRSRGAIGAQGTLLQQGASPVSAFRARGGHRSGAPPRRRRPARRRARSQHGSLRHHGVRRRLSRRRRRGVHTSGGSLRCRPPRGHPNPQRRAGPAHPAPYQWHTASWTTPSRSSSTDARLRPHRTP